MFTVGSASLAPEEISEWVRGIQIVLTNRKETSSLLTFSLLSRRSGAGMR